ncbi:hypothetical protein [Streptomyces anulatus]|uniref:hypothetical protein n=1 Tax=Streptomyces anulatus TaxID=1892 RepID=UPI002E37FAA1|nr:hypothetical protein [Streptomyces anulatus]WTD30623.1 hypothetical protein OH737_39320 [Streptomyces anulatus]
MEPDRIGGAVAARRVNRLAATGCLPTLIAAIAVLGLVVSWLWYRHWHDGDVNSTRREQTRASILAKAQTTANDTSRALAKSGTTDTDAIADVIWQLSEAPVITYDTSRTEFTATAAVSVQYDEKAMLPGGGNAQVSRCFTFTYTQRPDETWAPKVSEWGDEVCRPSTQIASRAHLALTRISSMYADDLTRIRVQNALDPTRPRSFDVKTVVREGNTMSIFVLVSSSDSEVNQCYRLTRPVPGDNNQGFGTAVPALSC